MKFFMNSLILILVLLSTIISSAFAEPDKNFTLTVDGKDYDIAIDGAVKVKSSTGEDLDIALKRKEFATFSTDYVAFEHRSELSVATTDISKHLHQYLATTALGTMVLVQQYDSMSPTTLNELMMKQLTDDDLRSGGKLEKKNYTQTLVDGKVMNGLYGHMVTGADDLEIIVVSADVGNGGIIAITRIEKEAVANDQPLVDRFWKTLKLK